VYNFYIAPRKGLAITLLEHDTNFVVRDGIVIDKNFMSSEEQRIPIGKHHAKLTLYYHLLPIHKTEQNKNVTPATKGEILNTKNYTDDVIKYQ
jgi:hypothetical protein